MKSLVLTLSILLVALSCGKTTSKIKAGPNGQNVQALYQSSKIKIRVFYEQGAEPFTEGPLGFKFWNILETNLQALFPKLSSTNIYVPKDLASMNKLSPKNKTSWTAQDVVDLSNLVGSPSSTTVAVFNIFFVNGLSSHSPGVIGFHVTGTNTIAIFKSVIEAAGSDPTGLISKYVEQATLIHEMGHAVGLVANGLPDTSTHQDTAHGHHCNDPECVMYYSNEGATSMVDFIKKAGMTGSTVMFDQKCLQDSKTYQDSLQ